MDQQNWFYRQNNQQIGPVGQDEIIRLLTQGQLTAESYVWTEGMENWLLVGQIPQLAPFVSTAQRHGRPQSVTVLGILNIVFGGLSLMCSPFGIIGLLMPQADNPFQLSAAMKLFSFFSYGLGFIMTIVLLASGIGLLNLKRWARQTAYIYGWFAVIWGIVGVIVSGFMLSAGFSNVPQEQMPAVVGGVVGGMCGGLLGLIYPVILIIFMRKPHVIEACNK